MTSHVETQCSYEPGYELVAWNISPQKSAWNLLFCHNDLKKKKTRKSN